MKSKNSFPASQVKIDIVAGFLGAGKTTRNTLCVSLLDNVMWFSELIR